MIRNILKIIPWSLAFLVFAVCAPFFVVGDCAMKFMVWLYDRKEGRRNVHEKL